MKSRLLAASGPVAVAFLSNAFSSLQELIVFFLIAERSNETMDACSAELATIGRLSLRDLLALIDGKTFVALIGALVGLGWCGPFA